VGRERQPGRWVVPSSDGAGLVVAKGGSRGEPEGVEVDSYTFLTHGGGMKAPCRAFGGFCIVSFGGRRGGHGAEEKNGSRSRKNDCKTRYVRKGRNMK
jgi:hypothetical protein